MAEVTSPRDDDAWVEVVRAVVRFDLHALTNQRYRFIRLIESDRGALVITAARLATPVLLLSPLIVLSTIVGGWDGWWVAVIVACVFVLVVARATFRQAHYFVECARLGIVGRDSFEKHRLVVYGEGLSSAQLTELLVSPGWSLWGFDDWLDSSGGGSEQPVELRVTAVFEAFRRKARTIVVVPFDVASSSLMETAVFESMCVQIKGSEKDLCGAIQISQDEAMDRQRRCLAIALGVEPVTEL